MIENLNFHAERGERIAIVGSSGSGKSTLGILLAKKIGLKTPGAAMVFGGLMGTTSGVSAGLAATDPSLVPYGTMVATFYSGTGCLLCPSLLYGIVTLFF